jgi:hypothetical protein
MLLVSSDIEDLIYQMKNYVAPTVEKWINKDNLNALQPLLHI